MHKINITGEIGWGVDADYVRWKLAQAKGEDIALECNSRGGDVIEGLSIMNLLQNYEGKITANISVACSMMTAITSVCHKVNVYENAVFMIHNASVGAWGDHKVLKKQAKLVGRLTDLVANVYVKKTGKTKKEMLKAMDEETYLFGKEIVDAGFADSVIMSKQAKKEEKVEAVARVQNRMTPADFSDDLNVKQFTNRIVACEGSCKKLEAIPSKKIVNINNNTRGVKMEEIQAQLDDITAQLAASTARAIEAETQLAKMTANATPKKGFMANAFRAGISMGIKIEDIATMAETAENEEQMNSKMFKALETSGRSFTGEYKKEPEAEAWVPKERG